MVWGVVHPGAKARRVVEEALWDRLRILRYARHAGGDALAALIVVNLLLGLLPVTFVVASSYLVGQIQPAVASGVGGAAFRILLATFLVAAGSFVLRQILTPVQAGIGELVKRRIDGHVISAIITESLRSDGMEAMEDEKALDDLKLASMRLEHGAETPGIAVPGLLALIARYLQLLGFVVIVGIVAAVPSAVLLCAVVLLFRYGQRGGLRRFGRIWPEIGPLLRRRDYLRETAIGSHAAKELRVFGLRQWVNDRYRESYLASLAPLWKRRRQVYLAPYLVYTVLGIVAVLVVLRDLVTAADSEGGSVTQLALGLQSVLAAVLLGAAYPESDVPTQFGMQADAALRRFRKRVDDSVDSGPAGTAEPQSLLRHAIRFENLSFSYPGRSAPVFENLNLELPAGVCTAIVGVNGAGKTTLVKLLARLYEPTGGRVLADGTDIRSFAIERWRRRISVVFQDFVRYESSVADNVAFGAPHLPRDRKAIEGALAKADLLHLMDRLPAGLQTPLSRLYDGGVDLSGGQWQRVAIARSMYALHAGAGVLILDEPTSALDVRAEADFFDRFQELTSGITALLISHRFSSVRRADWIIVLDGGHVVEQGTHDSLMAADGRYAALFRLQADRFAESADGRIS